MKRRDTHIDSPLARLQEPRVRRFVEPTLATYEVPTGSDGEAAAYHGDLQYCLDLGLTKTAGGRPRPANPIYASVISRMRSQKPFFSSGSIDNSLIINC